MALWIQNLLWLLKPKYPPGTWVVGWISQPCLKAYAGLSAPAAVSTAILSANSQLFWVAVLSHLTLAKSFKKLKQLKENTVFSPFKPYCKIWVKLHSINLNNMLPPDYFLLLIFKGWKAHWPSAKFSK